MEAYQEAQHRAVGKRRHGPPPSMAFTSQSQALRAPISLPGGRLAPSVSRVALRGRDAAASFPSVVVVAAAVPVAASTPMAGDEAEKKEVKLIWKFQIGAQHAEGNWHAGAIAAAADDVYTAAIMFVEGIIKVSVHYDISYFAQAKLHDEVEMDGRVVERKGRMTANMEVSDFFCELVNKMDHV